MFAVMIIIVIVLSLVCVQICESRPQITFVAFCWSWSIGRDISVISILN